MRSKTKANRKALAVGGVFLLPPAFIVYTGVQRLADIPPAVALFTVGGLALIAITLVFLGLLNLAEGDVHDAQIQFGGAALITLAEFAGQWWFAITEHHALVTALIFSMLSIGGAMIIESEIMRVWKANARQGGLMSLARPQVPTEVTREYPEVADYARRLAIRYPNSTQSSILDAAFAEHDRRQVETEQQQRRDLAELMPTVTVTAANLPDNAGQNPDSDPDGSGSPRDSSAGIHALPSASGSVSALVRTLIEAGVTDDVRVVEGVLRISPGANPETIRRNIRTIRRETA
jgi:hypothetical protein